MYQRPAQDGGIFIKAVPVGLYEESDPHVGNKQGAVWIRLAIAAYRQDIEAELKRWLDEETIHLLPPIDKETKEQSFGYLNQLIKPIIDCADKVAELRGNVRIDYIKWLFSHRMGTSFGYSQGGITGIKLEWKNVGQRLSRRGYHLDAEKVPVSVIKPFLDTAEKLLWQFVHQFCVHRFGEEFFTDPVSYYRLISYGKFVN